MANKSTSMKSYSLGEKLLIALLTVTTLHFADHVLRVDHSGWPFLSRLSPFTFFLVIIYGLLVVTWFARAKPKLRVYTSGFTALLAVLPHILVEPPHQIYGMWAYNHSAPSIAYPGNQDISNIFNITSPLLGVVSVVVVAVLVFLAIATFVAFLQEYRKTR